MIKLTVDAVVTYFPKREPKIWGSPLLLLVKRKYEPFKGQWALPGGHVDIEDESLTEACKREVKEETGVITDYHDQLDIRDEVGRDPRGRYITVPFYCHPKDYKYTPKLTPKSDADEAKWFNAYKAKNMNLAFDHNIILLSSPLFFDEYMRWRYGKDSV
jgi:8-oxo-dGTP diphosphatase